MLYTFMHKNTEVAALDIDPDIGIIRKIVEVYNTAHLPVCVKVSQEKADRASFNDWWINRAIPVSRPGLQTALSELNVPNSNILQIRCNGLSLSDQYWIRSDENIAWKDVNFFDNEFSNDVGDILMNKHLPQKTLNLSSPDNTSDGNLRKRWKILNGQRYLLKGGSAPFRQQPFNEVIASDLMEMLGIDHVPYTVVFDHDVPYSLCADFIDSDTDLVPAWHIYQTKKKPNNISVYRHFITCCEELGIHGSTGFLDKMITIDYLIANEDRHFNNFGVLRNADTLEWTGFAPVYDNGTCLGYNKVASQISAHKNIVCKPFKANHLDQLKLVTSFAWLDPNRLDCDKITDRIAEVFDNEVAAEFTGKDRIRAITASVRNRVNYLKKFVMEKQHKQCITGYTDVNSDADLDTQNDVTENVAEAYTE